MRKILFLICMVSFIVSGQEISTMTYNIRYATDYDGVNSWENRKSDLVNQLIYYSPDVIGMQEVLLNQKEYLENHLNDYQAIGVARDDGETKGEFSPIFYKSNQLNLIDSGTFWLSFTPEKPSKSWDAALPRICTFALFSLNEYPNQKFWVFNTHFDHVGIEARKNALKLIKQKIQSLNKSNYPFVVMGDFNLERDSEEIKQFNNNMVDTFGDFMSVYQSNHYGSHGTFNGFQFNHNIPTIDYIFSGGFKILKSRTIADKRENGLWISDHLPISATLIFKD